VIVFNLASSALTLNAVFPVGTCDVPKLVNGSIALVGVVFPPFALALAVARFALLVIAAFAFAVVVVVDAELFTPLFAIDPPPPMIGRNAVVDVNALPPRRCPRGIYRPNARRARRLDEMIETKKVRSAYRRNGGSIDVCVAIQETGTSPANLSRLPARRVRSSSASRGRVTY
jgi:hypothetical protein